jgi:anti-sigma regulatory factor (Ser/Thr protein kinase)
MTVIDRVPIVSRLEVDPASPERDLAKRPTPRRKRPRHGTRGSSGPLRTTGEKLETVYPPRRASAAQMRKTLRAFLAEQALDASVACDVVLAADEAFVNAVIHAGGAEDVIRVSARVSECEASVEVQDRGGGFTFRRSDPRSVPDVRRPNGRGVFLIENLMDEVSVRSGRGGTIVRMVRRLA